MGHWDGFHVSAACSSQKKEQRSANSMAWQHSEPEQMHSNKSTIASNYGNIVVPRGGSAALCIDNGNCEVKRRGKILLLDEDFF